MVSKMEKKDYLPCFQYNKCDITECPAYNNSENDKCWSIPNTLCKELINGERLPKDTFDKARMCFNKCEYFRIRKNHP